MKAEYAKLIDACIALEEEIIECYKNEPKLYAHSVEDVDDAYQAKLEWQWELRDLSDQYVAAQKEAASVIPDYQRPIRTAREYYKKYLREQQIFKCDPNHEE